MKTIREFLQGDIYQAYAYSYPHKTSYRQFNSPIDLKQVWAQENQQALFLYVHVPFCEMRCGFCNLFTLVRPGDSTTEHYVQAFKRQCEALSPVFNHGEFARFAMGGGTPTYLTPHQLADIFNTVAKHFNCQLAEIPSTIETAPDTATKDRLQLIENWGFSRISIGVQSFEPAECLSLSRRQTAGKVHQALERIKTLSTADLNIDLIYGIAGQSAASWLGSIKEALKYTPEELYLYPLYVRGETGLEKIKAKGLITTDQQQPAMLELYRLGRDYLRAEGYEQISMRMFRKKNLEKKLLPDYSCQEDGMLGLGAGARSYTQHLHYSNEYAVGRSGIKQIIESYNQQTPQEFTSAIYGAHLDTEEKKRRYLLQSLLLAEGLSTEDYQAKFGSKVANDFPELLELQELELAVNKQQTLLLTDLGMERADTLANWFISGRVKQKMQAYQLQ